MSKLKAVFVSIFFSLSIGAEALDVEDGAYRCDCGQKRGYCETLVEQQGVEIVITSSTKLCSKVTWFAGKEPVVSFVIDGELRIPWKNRFNPQLSAVSCEVCLDKEIQTSITLGECEMRYTDPEQQTGSYVGQCVDGLPNGNGIIVYDDGSEYKGDYKLGLRHGPGTMLWANGNYYTGSWLGNLPQGLGKMVWSDGRRYEGKWFRGKLQGYGTYVNTSGETIYGLWRKNQLIKK